RSGLTVHESGLTRRCAKTAPSLRVAPHFPPCGVAHSSFGTTKPRRSRLAWREMGRHAGVYYSRIGSKSRPPSPASGRGDSESAGPAVRLAAGGVSYPALAPEPQQQKDRQQHHPAEHYEIGVMHFQFRHIFEVHAEDAGD